MRIREKSEKFDVPVVGIYWAFRKDIEQMYYYVFDPDNWDSLHVVNESESEVTDNSLDGFRLIKRPTSRDMIVHYLAIEDNLLGQMIEYNVKAMARFYPDFKLFQKKQGYLDGKSLTMQVEKYEVAPDFVWFSDSHASPEYSFFLQTRTGSNLVETFDIGVKKCTEERPFLDCYLDDGKLVILLAYRAYKELGVQNIVLESGLPSALEEIQAFISKLL